MGLTFHPNPGTILYCDFSSGFKPPEMVKSRPVIVISPKRKQCSGLCTVVAVSTVAPSPVEAWHLQIPKANMPPTPKLQANDSWVKGDMIYRVAFDRLDLVRIGKDSSGNRLYFKQVLSPADMRDVHACVLEALNLGRLSPHL